MPKQRIVTNALPPAPKRIPVRVNQPSNYTPTNNKNLGGTLTSNPVRPEISRPVNNFTPNRDFGIPNGSIDIRQPQPKSLTNSPNTPRQSSPVTPTPRTPNQPSNGTMIGGGMGTGAIVGGLVSGMSGGDPIEGAVRGGAFAGGSIAGGLLLGGLAAAAGIPTGGIGGALVLGLGSYGAGMLASGAAGSIYGAAKRGLGFKDPQGVIDSWSTPVDFLPGQEGTPGQVSGAAYRLTNPSWGTLFYSYYGPIQIFKRYDYISMWHQRWFWVIKYAGKQEPPNVPGEIKFEVEYGPWSLFRTDGTSQAQDIAQGTSPGTPSMSINVTNNITNNYNYPNTRSNNSNDTPITLGNKTPTVNNPNSGNKPVDKSVDTSKPQNRSGGSSSSGRRQHYQGDDGYIWTLTKGTNGETYISSNDPSNKVDLTRSDVKESIKQFNKQNDSNQNPTNQLNNHLNSTGKTYEKTVDDEQISSNNTPEIISITNQENTSIINENRPTPTNSVNPIPDNNPNPNRDSNSVVNVINQQQKQGEDLVNNVVNPPVNPPVPESQQNQDYKALLEEQQKITTMLALGTGAVWLANQFSGVTNAVSNNTPTPCQWTADRNTVLTNQETANTQLTTANTTLGVVTNTQLVGINSTVTATNATVNATNSTVTTINTTANTISNNLTGLINTVGTATSTATTTLFGFVTKAYKTLYLDRVYNAMSFLMQVHNTAMLSRNVGESIGYLLSNTLSIFGIKDENDQPLDFGQILGNSVENFIKNIVGEDTYNGASMQWKRLSAIYSAVANIYDLILQNLSGIAEGIQIVGNYTGEIGNALKKGGVVLENAYEWMEDNFRIKTGRLSTIERINEGLESIENTASELTEVTEVWIEGRESVTEINEQVNNIKEQMAINVSEKLEAENQAKTASESPNLANSDLITPEPD